MTICFIMSGIQILLVEEVKMICLLVITAISIMRFRANYDHENSATSCLSFKSYHKT